jgi:hypothetical protein
MDASAGVEKPVSAEPYGTAMVVWLALQLCALALSASRTMLWARSPRASEEMALAVMLITQIIAAALLLPLLRGRRTFLILAATGWPMAQLAAFAADASLHHVILGEIYVCAWLMVVHVWSRLISSPPGRLYASAIAMLLSLGGPVLCYLSIDFAEEAPHLVSVPAGAFGPAMGAISQILPEQGHWLAWGELAILLLAGVLSSGFEMVIRRARRYRR